MRKTFPLEHPKLKPARVIDSIKNKVRKYLKRERSKTLPKGGVGVEPSGKMRAQAEPAGTRGTGRSQSLTLEGEIISSGPKQ